MSKGSKDIYGSDPDGGAAAIAASAIKLMKGKGVVTEAEAVEGKGTSSSHDVTGKLGQAKP
jgi:hypothetical protein